MSNSERQETTCRYRSDLIRAAMAAGSITVEELGEMANVGTGAVVNARGGGNIRVDTLASITAALKLDMKDLFDFSRAATDVVAARWLPKGGN